MSSLAQLTTAVQTMFTTHAEQAARDTACVRRRRRFTGPLWVQTLVLGCLQSPATTLTDLAQMAALLGVDASPQAIAQRFTPATAACLQQVLERAVQERISAAPVAMPVLSRFAEVVVLDTTTIPLPADLAEQWPGCGNGSGHPAAALKLGVRLGLRHGTLAGPGVETGRTHDLRCAITQETLPPGSLRIADLGFWSVAALAEITEQGGFWMSRLQAQTAVLTPDGDDLALDRLLATTDESSLEWEIRLGKTTQLAARLLAQRVPQEVAEVRRRRIRDDAKRRGHTPRQDRLQRADWHLLVTNVPATRLSVSEAIVLMRVRWQIELLFKQWKQTGRIDEVRSRNHWRILAEGYAKLIGMVVQHWAVVLGCWRMGNRSYAKAAQVVRTFAGAIGQSLAARRTLQVTLHRLVTTIAHSGVQNPRRTHPNLSQRLLELDDGDLT